MDRVENSQREGRSARTSTTYLPKLIAALSLILPAIIFVAAATFSYQSTFNAARANLDTQVDLAVQHARRVFAIFDLAASQTEEALLQFSDAEITAHDPDI